MTNNTYILPLPNDLDTYQIELPVPFDEMTDAIALEMMRGTIAVLAPCVANDAIDILEGNYSDDDTDYMPARAGALASLIYSLIAVDDSYLTELTNLLSDLDFVMNIMTSDIKLPFKIEYTD